MLRGWSERVPLVGMTKKSDNGLRHGHVAQTLHLVHQISLACEYRHTQVYQHSVLSSPSQHMMVVLCTGLVSFLV